MTDIAARLNEYADAVDADRDTETGLTDAMRQGADVITTLRVKCQSLEIALRYLLEVRGIRCTHQHPGPDADCARCVAEQAMLGVAPGELIEKSLKEKS